MPKIPNYAKFFSVYLRQNVPEEYTNEYRMDCPIEGCENPIDHFYANCLTGEWHCKRCDESGNARTLITILHRQYLAQTTKSQWKYLESMRNIKWETFKTAEWAYDVEHDTWFVPYFTYDPLTSEFTKYLNNLGYFSPSHSKYPFVIYKAPTLPLYLYNPGLHYIPHESGKANILEGEWDTLAYYDIYPKTVDLNLGKPGSGFPQTFLKTLVNCDNIDLLLDNDLSGRKQTAKAILTIREHKQNTNVNVLDWTLIKDAPKDVRALLIERPTEVSEQLAIGLVPYDDSDVDISDTDDEQEILTAGYVRDASVFPLITSFQEYLTKERTIFEVSQETSIAQAAVFSICISYVIPGEPLWIFLVSPPSSGKTVFIESFGGSNQWFDNLSKLTAESFISGWKDETGQEASYLPRLFNKTLFVKDFTTTLQGPDQDQRKIFGLLTDIYDGHVKIPFGNNQIKEFHNTYFNMIAGVTDIINAHSAASIGERFLRLDWLGKSYDSRAIARRALLNFGQSNEHKRQMTEWTLGYIRYLREQPIDIHIDENYIEPILDLADFVAIVRTKVESDRYEGMRYKPRGELPGRLAKQFAKLFVSAKVVTGNASDAFRVVHKVAVDTCHGFPMDIINFLLTQPASNREEIASGINVHSQRAYRVLDDLVTTKVLESYTVKAVRTNGRPRLQYRINPRLLPALKLDHENRPANRRPGQTSIASPLRQSIRRLPPPRKGN